MQLARDRRGIVAGKRHSQRFRRRRGGARREHALQGAALCGEPFLRLAAALADARRRRAQGALLGLQRREAAVRLRDGALGVAQRVARFAPRAFLFLQLFRQRVDARAQPRQLLLPRLRLRDADQESEAERWRERGKTAQVLALPCAATAAMRFSISAGSPR
ncbi:MAG TPA: hypothetical protein VM140_08665 [Burkholderiales bacterium]|nr:hypothetical protein [Burkholderiales bacterium]